MQFKFTMLNELTKEINSLANEEKSKVYANFFKTGKGHYGEGDIFLGLTMAQQRNLSQKYINLSFSRIKELLKNKIHEYRLIGLLILVERYKRSNERDKENIFGFYLKNIKYVNNWDLVDVSADKIVGDFLFEKDKKILYDLANSKNLWEKRISIVATFDFIRKNEFQDTLVISEILLDDSHDLIHKAVGWMLREVGKKDQMKLEEFLKFHYKKMPRTTLRYAIERFPEEKRKRYLLGNI